MFDQVQCVLLQEAVQKAVASLKREAANKPRFKEVAERDLAAYTRISSILMEMYNEASSRQKK